MTLTAPEPGTLSAGSPSTSYPPPPWRLRGPGAVVAAPVPLEVARRSVPAGLDVVPVWPGWTLGGVLLGRYGRESTLAYSELIAFSAMAHAGRCVGFWVSHIYVDLDASVAGGRDIWGLPKERADFDWGEDGSVSVRREGRPLLEAGLPRAGRRAPIPALAPVWGRRGDQLLHAVGRGEVRGTVTRPGVAIPEGSPLAEVGLRSPLASVAGALDLSMPAAREVAP